MKSINILWNFSRPHTVIGSIISICTLYVIVCVNSKTEHIPLLVMALLVGVSCNIFIVGINQIADVNIDRINKPYLPIPSGKLKMQQAKVIVYSCLLISLALALVISSYLFAIVALAMAVGWAYSMPPFRLKKHHLTAAIAISLVRGVLINAGGFMVFNYIVNKTLEMPDNLKILTVFIIAYSVVISWFKDIPDIKGDYQHKLKTFAILYSPRMALFAGNFLVSLAYLFSIYTKSDAFPRPEESSFERNTLFYGHIILFILFIANAFSINERDHRATKKFYKRFWLFFFAEYVLYFVAYF